MEKLRSTLDKYGHWSDLKIYIERIEAAREADFSLALENSKALLESIGKEICEKRSVTLKKSPSIQEILKASFSCLGYSNSDMVNQISRALANIGHEIGNLRNDISPTSHGRSLEELKERNSKVDQITRDFLLDSTIVVAVFLIRAFEHKNFETLSVHLTPLQQPLEYEDSPDFNDFWDENYGEFHMGVYSYPASEILFRVDIMGYQAACAEFQAEEAEESEV
jgi:Abortive infection C-terminus